MHFKVFSPVVNNFLHGAQAPGRRIIRRCYWLPPQPKVIFVWSEFFEVLKNKGRLHALK